MTDEEFAAGVDLILASGAIQHASHRALDLLWTRYAIERGGVIAEATHKWMAAIEGDHIPGKPYPLPVKSWWRLPLPCKFGFHLTIVTSGDNAWGSTYVCGRCGHIWGSGNPCP